MVFRRGVGSKDPDCAQGFAKDRAGVRLRSRLGAGLAVRILTVRCVCEAPRGAGFWPRGSAGRRQATQRHLLDLRPLARANREEWVRSRKPCAVRLRASDQPPRAAVSRHERQGSPCGFAAQTSPRPGYACACAHAHAHAHACAHAHAHAHACAHACAPARAGARPRPRPRPRPPAPPRLRLRPPAPATAPAPGIRTRPLGRRGAAASPPFESRGSPLPSSPLSAPVPSCAPYLLHR
jgi:hypothetical protein